MKHPLSPEKEREFAELSAFLDLFATRFWKVDPAAREHPTNVLRHIVEVAGKTKALVGLRQAINDAVEEAADLTREEVLQWDAELRAAGVVTLTELRHRHSRQYRALLRRGSIRNETEYYLAKEVLNDYEGLLDPEEEERLGAMVLAFETAIGSPGS